jgi:hypothetical protein
MGGEREAVVPRKATAGERGDVGVVEVDLEQQPPPLDPTRRLDELERRSPAQALASAAARLHAGMLLASGLGCIKNDSVGAGGGGCCAMARL